MSKITDRVAAYFSYRKDLAELKKQKGNDNAFPLGKKRMILNEKFAESGIASGHYFHQDLLIARRIFENKPVRHIDIGSRTDGFVAHVASYREIEVLDIREQTKKIKNIRFQQADLSQLPKDMIECCDSISSLHVVEHFGLGRYNDKIDYTGHLKAFENIYRIVKPGGKFYFSTPIGRQRIEFNAHRVFSVNYLLDLFKTKYSIDHFSFVNDAGDLFENVELSTSEVNNNFGCSYGCGIFEMTKK